MDTLSPSTASRWEPTLLAVLLVMLCFTLALLAFSRPDYRRFAQVAEGLAAGFGRAGALQEEPIPLGSAVVARSFVPEGEPVPVDAPWTGSGQLPPLDLPPLAATSAPEGPAPELLSPVSAGVDAVVARTRAEAATLAARFRQGIARGEVEIETRGRSTVLRLLEKGAFTAGSQALTAAMRGQIEELGPLLAADPGLLVLRSHHAGANPGEASDWAVSAGRAAAVADALQARAPAIAPRLTVVAYGASRQPADARPGRRNRVEIALMQPLTPELVAALDALRKASPEAAAGFASRLDPQTTEVP